MKTELKVFLKVFTVLILFCLTTNKANAAITYTHSGESITMRYDQFSDFFAQCSYDPNYWLISVAYDNFSTYAQSDLHTASENPISYTFNIPSGTKIQMVEAWVGQTPEEAQQGTTCEITLDYNLNGVYTIGVAPVISSIAVSNVTDTSAIITWTTDTDSDSKINYGLTDSYGSQKADSNLTKTHSIKISSLSQSTTYHYNVQSTDALGNNSTSSDATFSTTAPGITPTPTPVVIEVTPTPTPTPPPDKTPPTVSLSTVFAKPFAKAPQISGSAKDNKSVAKIEYSIDNGKDWLLVDAVTFLSSTSAKFSFTPAAFDDGNYTLKVRATDSSGNLGLSKKYTFVIDRLSPQVSGSLFSLGPQVLNQEVDGSLTVLENQKFKLTMSEVGGTTNLNVFIQDINKKDLKKYEFVKDAGSSLWSAIIEAPKEGEYQLRYEAVDGAGNFTKGNLNKLNVLRKGKINTASGKITVYYQDVITKNWQVWDGKPYLQENPVAIDKNGNYSLTLPGGKYYLHIEANGYQSSDSDFFEVENSESINADFNLKSLKLLLNLGVLKFYWPDFSISTARFKNNYVKLNSSNALEGKKFPYFNLSNFNTDSLLGKPSIVTFINTWSPSSLEQLSILNQLSEDKNYNVLAVAEGEKPSKLYVLQKRGNYSLSLIADMDATLVSVYNLNNLPVSFFLDRNGVIKKVTGTTLSEIELQNILKDISQ